MRLPYMNRISMLAPLASIALAAAAADLPRSMQLDGIAAEVGGRRLTISEVMSDARDIAFSEGRTDVIGNPSVLLELYAQALTNRVNRQLILIQYEKGDAKIPEWYFNQRIERIIETSFDGNKAALVEALESRGTSYAEWRKRRVDDMIYATMRQQYVDANVKVRPSDVERVYREKYAGTTLPGHTKVSMIAFPCGEDEKAAVAKATALVEGLRKGDDFAAVARRESKEPHAEEGGSWGYIEPAEELRAELVSALKPLGIGAVSDPIVLAGYVYILRKDDDRADLSVPLELVRAKIEEDIAQEEGETKFAEWLALLSRRTTVRIFPLR